MEPGQDERLIKIHEYALNDIGGILIRLQDSTLERMNEALEAAESALAAARAENERLHAALNEYNKMIGDIIYDVFAYRVGPDDWPKLEDEFAKTLDAQLRRRNIRAALEPQPDAANDRALP